MSIVTLPSSLPLGPGSRMGQQRYDLVAVSETTGAQQVRPMGPPRWMLTLVQPATLPAAHAGQWQGLIVALRGRINHLAAWDPGRPVPMGTMRGTPSLGASAAVGASAITVATGQPGCTLLAGDRIQIGTGLGTSQLVMVTANATADGSGSLALSIEAPLRQAFASGVAVAWNRPLGYFRAATDQSSWSYPSRNAVQGMALDLLEAFA